ncbi:MAG: hypothetical protein FK730_17180 [Asgard group archaeon]|nr:hypothetical protein [Asgard group archaeon]
MTTKKNALCPICKADKKTQNDKYCKIHLQAKDTLQRGYESWLKAYGILPWDDYLKQLLNLGDLVGDLIRDVIEYEFYFKES